MQIRYIYKNTFAHTCKFIQPQWWQRRWKKRKPLPIAQPHWRQKQRTHHNLATTDAIFLYLNIQIWCDSYEILIWLFLFFNHWTWFWLKKMFIFSFVLGVFDNFGYDWFIAFFFFAYQFLDFVYLIQETQCFVFAIWDYIFFDFLYRNIARKPQQASDVFISCGAIKSAEGENGR